MIAVHLSFLSALRYQFSNEDWYIASASYVAPDKETLFSPLIMMPVLLGVMLG